jgi:hypothetical protein
MSTTTRTLPAVIGPTENALRAVLLAVLSRTPINGYDEWAAVNVVDRHAGTGEETIRAVAAPLGITHPAGRAVLDTLVAKGLLDSGGVSWTVSQDGATVLRQARARVAAVTARLVEGLSPADIEVAVRVLDHVRVRARGELDTGDLESRG